MKGISLITAVVFSLEICHASFAQQAKLKPASSQTEKGKSEWVYPGKDGKLVYKTTAAGDRIMDFSHAGYMGGGVALPDVPVKRTVYPSGGSNDTEQIQAAIDAVSTLPLENGFRGAVLLAPGIFTCSGPIIISADGVVLRGSGSTDTGTMIKMTGDRHTAIVIGRGRNISSATPNATTTRTSIVDAYVPSGVNSFTVAGTKGFAVGDRIEIRKPVTDAWIEFMQMHNLTRDGKPQTWMRAGTYLTTQRFIKAITGNKIILDVPLSDNIDYKFLKPASAEVVKIQPTLLVKQSGAEFLRIQAPPMEISYQVAPYTALRINGEDCWARAIKIEETMNSVGVNGSRITLERIAVTRTFPNLGASKPAEFAPNASQLLLDRCSSIGDNIWHAATGAGQAGPIVMLNCTFGGNGHIEGHQRWTTGILLDNCRLPDGGIDFKNRGSMGSGHGWGTGWSVAWNCLAKSYVIQQPPGATNWMIGCVGPNIPTPRPFNAGPTLPLGVSDVSGSPVVPQSLYLMQLAERLGVQAVKNIGYSLDDPAQFSFQFPKSSIPAPATDPVWGRDVAAFKYANPSNVRGGETAFGGERAFDRDHATYWSTNDGVTAATLEIDLEEPQLIYATELREAKELKHVQAYKVEAMVNSDWILLSEGTTIGDRKIDKFPPVLAWKVRLTILKASASPAISTFSVYANQSTALK